MGAYIRPPTETRSHQPSPSTSWFILIDKTPLKFGKRELSRNAESSQWVDCTTQRRPRELGHLVLPRAGKQGKSRKAWVRETQWLWESPFFGLAILEQYNLLLSFLPDCIEFHVLRTISTPFGIPRIFPGFTASTSFSVSVELVNYS
jgi:hypothetical protein